MITNADITIFNKAIGENRREVFIPTTISGVSWYDVHSVEEIGRAHVRTPDTRTHLV